jgi:hypothetical protein
VNICLNMNRFTIIILSSAQGAASVDDELKTHILYRAGISRAFHGVSGDLIFTSSGVKISTLSLGLPITTSAGIGIELQVRYDAVKFVYVQTVKQYFCSQPMEAGWL